jgi:hypothetical protein
MGQLNGWMVAEGLGAGDVTRRAVQQFLDGRRTRGDRRVPTPVSFEPLLASLLARGVVPGDEPGPPTGRDLFLARFRHYLVQDRGLMPTTVRRYETDLRPALPHGEIVIDGRGDRH